MKSTDYMKSMMKTVLSHKEKDGIKQELQDCIDDLTDRYIASGINNIINMINPEAIVIGGEISCLGEPFLAEIKKELAPIMFAADMERLFNVVLVRNTGTGEAQALEEKTYY